MKTTSLGFDKENVMIISPTEDLLNNIDAFKTDLQQKSVGENRFFVEWHSRASRPIRKDFKLTMNSFKLGSGM